MDVKTHQESETEKPCGKLIFFVAFLIPIQSIQGWLASQGTEHNGVKGH